MQLHNIAQHHNFMKTVALRVTIAIYINDNVLWIKRQEYSYIRAQTKCKIFNKSRDVSQNSRKVLYRHKQEQPVRLVGIFLFQSGDVSSRNFFSASMSRTYVVLCSQVLSQVSLGPCGALCIRCSFCVRDQEVLKQLPRWPRPSIFPKSLDQIESLHISGTMAVH